MFTTRVDCFLAKCVVNACSKQSGRAEDINIYCTIHIYYTDLEEVGVRLDARGVEGVVLRAHRDDDLVVRQLEVGPELRACITGCSSVKRTNRAVNMDVYYTSWV